MSIKLSIGIAVYNIREDFLRACVESVCKMCGDDAEIIIIDDCSTYNCFEIVSEYAQSDGRIRLLRFGRNIGISAVRNKIISLARGEWILFVDGDDMLIGNVSKIMQNFDLLNSDVVTFGISRQENEIADCGASIFHLSQKDVHALSVSALVRYDAYKEFLPDLNLHPCTVCACAYRKSYLTANGFLFDENLRIAEDSVFNTNVFLKKPRYAHIPSAVYFYRLNPQSVMNRYNPKVKKWSVDYLNATEEILNKNFCSEKNVRGYFWIYRVGGALYDVFERDIFHHDNKKSAKVRKDEFLSIVSDEIYVPAMNGANADMCKYPNLRLILKLAVKRRFSLIDFAFSHRFVFVLYGGISRRLRDLGIRSLTERKAFKK